MARFCKGSVQQLTPKACQVERHRDIEVLSSLAVV
jgi:hypothetical protein